jgi:hypothetical protein
MGFLHPTGGIRAKTLFRAIVRDEARYRGEVARR